MSATPTGADHEKRELVNLLTEIARKYHGTEQLRDRIAHALAEAQPAVDCGSNGTVDCQSTPANLRCAACPHPAPAAPLVGEPTLIKFTCVDCIGCEKCGASPAVPTQPNSFHRMACDSSEASGSAIPARPTLPGEDAKPTPVPGQARVDKPDGVYGADLTLPGDPPGPCDVRRVINGYVWWCVPGTKKLRPVMARTAADAGRPTSQDKDAPDVLSLLQRARLYTTVQPGAAETPPFAAFRSELDAAIAALGGDL